jgi:hypothetical protein
MKNRSETGILFLMKMVILPPDYLNNFHGNKNLEKTQKRKQKSKL